MPTSSSSQQFSASSSQLSPSSSLYSSRSSSSLSPSSSPSPTPTPKPHTIVYLNQLPTTLFITAATTIFSYTIPADTFWDTTYGFTDLKFGYTGKLPAWLSFDASTGVFSGFPTTQDVGVVLLRIYATTIDGQQSEGQPLTILVRYNGYFGYLFSAAVRVSIPTNSRRRGVEFDEMPMRVGRQLLDSSTSAPTIQDCSNKTTLTGTERISFIEIVSNFLNVSESDLSLIVIIKIQTAPCEFLVDFTVNSIENCGDALNMEQELNDGVSYGNFSGDLLPHFVFEGLSTLIPQCSMILFPAAGSHTNTLNNFQATVLPVAIIAGILLILGLLGFFIFRRVARKEEKGINSTFAPRKPLVLSGERAGGKSELDRTRRPVVFTDEHPPFDDSPVERAAPSYDQVAVGRQTSTRNPPSYRPPPNYPMASLRSRKGSSRAGTDDSSSEPSVYFDERTVTTTTETNPYTDDHEYEVPKAPPGYRPPPSFQQSILRADRIASTRSPPGYKAPPVFGGKSIRFADVEPEDEDNDKQQQQPTARQPPSYRAAPKFQNSVTENDLARAVLVNEDYGDIKAAALPQYPTAQRQAPAYKTPPKFQGSIDESDAARPLQTNETYSIPPAASTALPAQRPAPGYKAPPKFQASVDESSSLPSRPVQVSDVKVDTGIKPAGQRSAPAYRSAPVFQNSIDSDAAPVSPSHVNIGLPGKPQPK